MTPTNRTTPTDQRTARRASEPRDNRWLLAYTMTLAVVCLGLALWGVLAP